MRLKLDLLIIVLRDNAYGMIEWKQRIDKFKDFGLHFGNPDFVQFAQAHGARGYCIKSADEFFLQMQECLTLKGVHLIEVPIDYVRSSELLNKILPNMTQKL